eukprot:COSAG05_NODE_105_length_18793_cov_115.346421_4_plen_79_part_00
MDIGPGFNTDWARTLHGHRLQGLVVLVLLSDCPAGWGGTAFVSGSCVDSTPCYPVLDLDLDSSLSAFTTTIVYCVYCC